MNVRVCEASTLLPAQLDLWSAWLRTDVYESPFFHPDFARLVASQRTDVRVLCVEDRGEPVAFWPVHTGRGGIARPLGLRLADYHGPVFAPGAALDLGAILRAAGLRVWKFDHLPAATVGSGRWTHRPASSPFADLSSGFAGYRQQQRAGGSSYLTQAERKARKMAREVGPLRFSWHEPRDAVFEDLLRWKSEQRVRTGTFDVLAYDWVRDILRGAVACADPGMRGCLAALYAGERLVAAHLGLASDRVLHYWFPSFDFALERYSPGMVLNHHLLREAAATGLHRVDFGCGAARYKASLGNGEVALAVGAVDLRPVVRHVTRWGARGTAWLSASPLGGWVRGPKRVVRRVVLDSLMRAR